jgi:signal transduction histidine kinase
VLSLTEAGLTEMRALIFQLRPESLGNEGLVVALTRQAQSLQARHGIKVESDLGEEPQIPLPLKQTLYLIAREAMHNTVKHAHAQHVRLALKCDGERCLLDIADDGIGFDTTEAHLQSMTERVNQVRGTLVLESEPGFGTKIHVAIPLPKP